ncbi:hypothetical protein V1478_010150 [Vespula squamosa]|uniref:Uncharacterized protein n=1 Tax=Vespula squamosa TaxID=30214 RepID=A0ABD2AIY5_VESSQ
MTFVPLLRLRRRNKNQSYSIVISHFQACYETGFLLNLTIIRTNEQILDDQPTYTFAWLLKNHPNYLKIDRNQNPIRLSYHDLCYIRETPILIPRVFEILYPK